MKYPKAKNIDEYLERLPEKEMNTLSRLRKVIKSVAPNAEEAISYGMPGFKYYGALVYFAAFKNHCSFFPGSSQTIKLFDELKEYRTSKGTIQFTADNPLPTALVKKIVKARMTENEMRQISKSNSKKGIKLPAKQRKSSKPV